MCLEWREVRIARKKPKKEIVWAVHCICLHQSGNPTQLTIQSSQNYPKLNNSVLNNDDLQHIAILVLLLVVLNTTHSKVDVLFTVQAYYFILLIWNELKLTSIKNVEIKHINF